MTTFLKTWLPAAGCLFGLAAAAAAALPPAPEQLRASAGNASVGLVWNASSDSTVTQYALYAKVEAAANTSPVAFSLVAQIPAVHTSYLASGLINSSAYTYKLTAVNPNGESAASNTVTAYPAVLPQAPSHIVINPLTLPAPQVQLSWSPVTAETFPIAAYSIYRSVSGSAQMVLASVTTTACTDTAVTTQNAFADYFYQIAAVDQKGNTGAFSASAHASLAPTGNVPVPQGLSVTAQNGQLIFLWTPALGADGYQLNLIRASTGFETVYSASAPNTFSAVSLAVPVPNNGELYLASLAAVTAGSLSPRTQISGYALAPAVTGLNILAGDGYFQLSWDPASASGGVTGYDVFGDTTDGTTLLNPTPLTSTRYIDVSGVAKFYAIRAVVNQSVVGLPGQTLTAAAAGSTPPPLTPLDFSVALASSQTLNFSWNPNFANDQVTAYHLYALDGPFSGYQAITSSVSEATVTNLTNGQNYRFFLTAVNVNGESAASLTLTASPLAPPVNFSSQVSGNAVLLSWKAGDNPSGINAYQLFSGTGGNFTAMTYLTSTAQTAFTLAPLRNNTYGFRLSAINALGQVLPAAFSSTLTAVVSAPPAPPFPIRLTPGDRTVSILWRSVSTDVTSYTIYRASISGSYTEPLAANIASKITYYVDNTLTSRNLPPIINTQTYFYTMTAVNDAGESSRSAEYSVIPYKPSQLPDNPAIRTSYLRRSVSLVWDASISMEGNGGYPIVGYNIYRSQDGGSSFRWLEGSGIPPATIPLPAGNSTPALSYLDLDIAYGNVYEYRIQALDFDSLHNISHEGTAYLIARVPVDFPNNRMDVLRNAFNPAKGESVPVTLSEVQPGHTWVKIYNLAGELICTLWEGNVDAQYNPDYPFLLNLAWDGKNSRGELVASGVYIIHAEGQSRYHQTRKVAVIK